MTIIIFTKAVTSAKHYYYYSYWADGGTKIQGKQGSTYSKGVMVQVVVGENGKEEGNILERVTKANMWLHMKMEQGE